MAAAARRGDFDGLFGARLDRADVEDPFPPEVPGARLERFVELSTTQALREAFGGVTVSAPRILQARP